MFNKYLIILGVLCTGDAVSADNRMLLGDDQIDGTVLNSYRFNWRQCALQDGEWIDQGTLSEELIVLSDNELQQRQSMQLPGGIERHADTVFDRASFAPKRMAMEATKDGVRFAASERRLTADGYTGVVTQGEERRELEGKINSTMLHGGAMGLPLATMKYQDEPVQFAASMMAFDGTYDVTAEWVGKEMLEFDGQQVESWMIDVTWHHRETGDIYPPGPDASGGRYWVVPEPPAGYPYVPRYRTDTYVVEFEGLVSANPCPG